MKKTIFILSIIILSVVSTSLFSISFAQEFEVVTRDSKGRSQFELKRLNLNRNSFENADFKIVKGKSLEALSVDQASELGLTLKAASTFYHLSQAKEYFISKLNSPEVMKLEKITVRIEHTNRFSDLGHFMNDAAEPEFNNALSIPSGKGFEGRVPSWSREIWFRPKKEIPSKEILSKLNEDPLQPTIRQMRQIVYPMQLDQGIRNVLYSVVNQKSSEIGNSLLNTSVRQAGTLLLVEGIFEIGKFINRLTLPSQYYIDTALVPEIIQHEFSHIALSDSLDLSHSTPVIEGLADYFAASMGGSPKLAAKIKEFSTAQSKNGKNKKAFSLEFESNQMANSDFVLSLLWGLRDLVGVEQADRVIFEARRYLNTSSSDIRTGLLSALLKSCHEVCINPSIDRLKFYQYFGKRGL